MTAAYGQDRQQQAPNALWGALVAVGVVLTVLGVLLLIRPFDTAEALAWLVGFALALSGIIDMIQAARGREGAAGVLLGALQVIGGVVVVAWPGATLRVIAIIVGLSLVVAGLVRFAAVYWARKQGGGDGGGGGGGSIALAAVTVAVGVMALVWPGATIAVLAVLFGIQFIYQGVTRVLVGLALRPRPL